MAKCSFICMIQLVALLSVAYVYASPTRGDGLDAAPIMAHHSIQTGPNSGSNARRLLGPPQPKPGEVPQQEALNVTTCQKGDPGYDVCLGFVPVCRPSGYACNPSTSTKQSIYITAYPVSVRTVVDKSMEIEILMQYYLFWQDTSVDAGTDLAVVWKPSIVVQDAVKIDWIIQDKISYTITDKIQAEVTGLGLTNMKLSGRAKFYVTNRGKWDLNSFPFDTRTMHVDIANLQPTYTTLVSFYYNGFTRSMSGKLPGIWLSTSDFQLIAQTNTEISGATDVVVQLAFDAKRNSVVYIETCMFPVTACFLVTYFGFYVPITVRMPRFATAIISFLTTASLKRAIEAKIPAGAVDCFLEKWLTFQMGLLMLCCIMHMAAYNVHEHRKIAKSKGKLKPGRTTHTPDVDMPLRVCLPIMWLLSFVQAALSSSGDHTKELISWLVVVTWFIPIICGKGLLRRLGCLFCLLGYDEDGSHEDPWNDPSKAENEVYMNDEDEWEDVDGVRAPAPAGGANGDAGGGVGVHMNKLQ